MSISEESMHFITYVYSLILNKFTMYTNIVICCWYHNIIY